MIDPTEPHTLLHPITITIGDREERVEIVQLRRPKGKDLRALDKATGDVDGMLLMIARLGGLTVAVADELDAADIDVLGDRVQAFTPKSPKTGSTTSGT